ncbi:hypothetical protein CsatB_019166 [Cannabis sativa]
MGRWVVELGSITTFTVAVMGASPFSTWRYLVHHGVVTEVCDPYFDDTDYSHPGCELGFLTPKCARK